MIERDDPVNWSTLKYMRESPKHYRYRLDNPRTDTDALLLGRAVHCLIYEPDEYENRYIVSPRFHRGMKDSTAVGHGYHGGRESAEEWDASVAASDLEVIPAEIGARAEAMRDAVLADPVAAPLVIGGYSEQRITWTDAETGIECRGRVDHINGRLSDLKTSRNINPRLFASDAVRYGYHAQMPWYEDGLAANGITTHAAPAFVVVENDPPYDVVVYEVGSNELEAGRAVYRECLALLARCRELDLWPGMAQGKALGLTLPAWAMPIEEELTMGGVPIF